MDVSIQVFVKELAPLADYLNVPVMALVVAALLALGLFGHVLIDR